MHPYQVMLRNITEQSAFIFAERHGLGDEVDEDFRIHEFNDTGFDYQIPSDSLLDLFPLGASYSLIFLKF